jgi:CubicO group peptidase (beta-lactamase class C family)
MLFRPIARLLACCTALLGSSTAHPQSTLARAGDDLLGLWGAEPMLGPQVRGALLLQRSGDSWTMRVGGFEARATQVGDSVTITLPGGQGTLRLWVAAGRPDAYWIQPAGMEPPYATPVRVRDAGPNIWRGAVTPIDAQFPLYLAIAGMPDGTLHGVFRNPAQNWPGRVPYYLVARDGESVTFTHPTTGKLQWRQPYDSARRTITFDFDGPIVLSPKTVEQAVGFVARSPSLQVYDYRRPADIGDGWSVSSSSALAVDQRALEAIVRAANRVDPLNDTVPRVHALLVARRGQLVLEEYFRGYAQDLPHDMRSASKTMTSIMVGAAKERGAAITSLTAVAGSQITVGALLSHSSGLACDDDDDASPGNEDRMQSQQAQLDWYAFFLALPKVHESGTTYAYCSAGVNVAGKVISDATGLWLPRLFETALARPLRISTYGMNLMPTGNAYAGGGMHLRPRDFLKFGQLYLDGGVWRGARLVNASWVRESIAHRIDRPDGSDDGLGWHRHVLTVGAHRYQTYEASGNGGQFLVVVPELQLTVVVTAGNYGQYTTWTKIRDELMTAVLRATH